MTSTRTVILFFLSIFALVVSIAVLVALSIYIKPSYIVLGIALISTIVSSLSIIYLLKSICISEASTYKEKYIFWVMAYLMFIVIVFTIPVGYFINSYDQKKYSENNLKLFNSIEFKQVVDLAKSNKVYVRLGNTNTAWEKTRLLVPDASSASLYIYNGYCGLNYDDESSFDMKKSIVQYIPEIELKKNTVDLAKLSILMHEYGHCEDMKRDFLSFNVDKPHAINEFIIGTEAIVPKNRKHVKDIESYLLNSIESTLWIEVFADVYSIGYMYINYPNEAERIAQGIKKYRVDKNKNDSQHNTSCYIDLVFKTEKPKSQIQLVEWADKIRKSDECKSNFL